MPKDVSFSPSNKKNSKGTIFRVTLNRLKVGFDFSECIECCNKNTRIVSQFKPLFNQLIYMFKNFMNFMVKRIYIIV